ncbi:MAG TPA: hypothetical protein VKP30_13635, partial [Polyangiaceae bacterium]|nr:hypothetical protein [Polyangiaceae bacterium]
MIDRLDLYDVLSAIVPGAVLVTGAATLFSNLKSPFIASGLPSEFAFVALVSGAMIAGQVVQTVGSALEPLLFRLFGGRPSDLAISGRLAARYLPDDASKRIVEKLRIRCGRSDASDHGLFLYAMNTAECSSNSKVRTFNAQFGHLRALFTTAVLVL